MRHPPLRSWIKQSTWLMREQECERDGGERERMMDDGRRVTRRVEVFFYLDVSKRNCLIDSDNNSYNYLSIYRKCALSRYLSITS